MKKNYNSIGTLTSFSIVMFKSWLNSVFIVIVSIYWYFVDFLKCNFCKKQNKKKHYNHNYNYNITIEL